MVVRINLMHKFSFPNASISNFEKLIERKSLFQFTNDCYATTRRFHPYVYKRQTCKLTVFDRVEFCVVSDSFARPGVQWCTVYTVRYIHTFCQLQILPNSFYFGVITTADSNSAEKQRRHVCNCQLSFIPTLLILLADYTCLPSANAR